MLNGMDLVGVVVYVSGAMSGLEGRNYDAFNRMEEMLEERGAVVLNPASNEIDDDVKKEDVWQAFMDISEQQVRDCDMVVAMEEGVCGSLGSWRDSSGAMVEKDWAIEFGKEFVVVE